METAPQDARAGTPIALPVKLGFAAGDHAVNISLATISVFLLYFLTEVAGLRPALASMVLLVGRAVDAFTDPAMGRLSDLTRTRFGRRRPYFLLGAIPFGLTFACLWQDLPGASQEARFAMYAGVYVLHALASTVVTVPYMALLPEMALDYVERTAMNVYRAAAAITGVFVASVAIQPAVGALGGGAVGWGSVGWVLGLWMILPWFVVFRVSWERSDTERPAASSLWAGMRGLARNSAYLRLVAIFLSARIAVDVVGAMFVFYFHYWLGRPEDFPLTMALMLLAVLLSMPVWMRLSRSYDKHVLFAFAAVWWIAVQALLLLAQPDWPRAWVFAIACAGGIGYGLADLMPLSMLGEVVDADELASGERREGIYAGVFTFLRKLGGATGVFVAGAVLDVAGFASGAEQPEPVLWAIRLLTTAVPAVCLAVAAGLAWTYPLTRERHGEILAALRRRGETGSGKAPAEI